MSSWRRIDVNFSGVTRVVRSDTRQCGGELRRLVPTGTTKNTRKARGPWVAPGASQAFTYTQQPIHTPGASELTPHHSDRKERETGASGWNRTSTTHQGFWMTRGVWPKPRIPILDAGPTADVLSASSPIELQRQDEPPIDGRPCQQISS